MWQPTNKAALPSPGDFKLAKKAIDDLEDALKDALAVLEQAQSKVLALTEEIDERKAWIASIRKLPHELLSEIFIFGSEMEHLAPVTITEVSRLWREVVLATPRAWSLIYTHEPEHRKHLVQYVSTFVERSNPCLLHIWIQDDLGCGMERDDSDYYESWADRVLPLFRSSLSRIQCLSIDSSQLKALDQECMPDLTRLMITDMAGPIPPFFINRDRFPRLQSIHSTGCFWGNSLALTSFPPLQELAIKVTYVSTWLDVVKNCSGTLKALTLRGQLEWAQRITIIFQQLQSLTFIDWSRQSDPADWRITMVTPGLLSYKEISPASPGSALRHGDVKSVTHLQISHFSDLTPYTNLRVLQLFPLYIPSYVLWVDKLAEQLEQDIRTCPVLELAEFYLVASSEEHLESESSRRGIIKRMKGARPGVEVSFTKRLLLVPGSMEESLCGPDMPCSTVELYENGE